MPTPLGRLLPAPSWALLPLPRSSGSSASSPRSPPPSRAAPPRPFSGSSFSPAFPLRFSASASPSSGFAPPSSGSASPSRGSDPPLGPLPASPAAPQGRSGPRGRRAPSGPARPVQPGAPPPSCPRPAPPRSGPGAFPSLRRPRDRYPRSAPSQGVRFAQFHLWDHDEAVPWSPPSSRHLFQSLCLVS